MPGDEEVVFLPAKDRAKLPFKSYASPAGKFVVIGKILDAYRNLGEDAGFLGAPLADSESTGNGERQRFASGAIYSSPTSGTWEIHGLIRDEYERMQGPASFLGFPTSNEVATEDGGAVSAFEGGWIFWWPNFPPVALSGVRVSFTGFRCNRETDDKGWGFSSADEIYVLLGALAPNQDSATRSQVFEGVDKGERRAQEVVVFEGPPSGVAVSTTVMERDSGDPDEYLKLVQLGVNAGKKGVGALIQAIPYIGEVLAILSDIALETFGEDLAKAINDTLGTGDDLVGNATFTLSPKQLVTGSLGPEKKDGAVPYRVATSEISGDGGKYVVYFNTELLREGELIDL